MSKMIVSKVLHASCLSFEISELYVGSCVIDNDRRGQHVDRLEEAQAPAQQELCRQLAIRSNDLPREIVAVSL